jgi:hypothetical protein
MAVDATAWPRLNQAMKALLLLVPALGLMIVCAGCARNYNITTTSGRVITSRGKPHYDKEGAVFVFTDANGQERQIPAGSVSQIAPGSDKSSPTSFNAKPAR